MAEDIDLCLIASEICDSLGLILINKVGEGTFKETFQVSDGKSKNFALKIYKSVIHDVRSQREIEAMMRCDHPGIASIIQLDTIEYNGEEHLFIIEEYFSGGTLIQKCSNCGLLEIDDVIDLGRKLIEAVSHFAELDLVHRDIKPENILFKDDGINPVITDFGIVRDLQATSETMSWLPRGPGTSFFAAPEQLTNDKRLIDWRTDQFSLGITLSLCTFGDHPYAHSGFNSQRTIQEVAEKGNTSTLFKSRIEESGLTALQTMVAVYPANRFRTPDLLMENWNSQVR